MNWTSEQLKELIAGTEANTPSQLGTVVRILDSEGFPSAAEVVSEAIDKLKSKGMTMCICHPDRTFCPDEVFSHYEDDVSVFIRRSGAPPVPKYRDIGAEMDAEEAARKATPKGDAK